MYTRDADTLWLLTVCTFKRIRVEFQWVLFGGVVCGARPMERRHRERGHVRRWLLLPTSKQHARIAAEPTTRW